MQRLDLFGETDGVTTVIKNDKIASYKVLDNIQRVKFSNLPKPVLQQTDSYYNMMANIALLRVWSKNQDAANVLEQIVPRKRLLAADDIESGKLILAPWSHGSHLRSVDASGNLTIDVMTDPPKYFSICVPSGSGKKFNVHFWKMGHEIKDAVCANMKMEKRSETVNWPVNIGLGKDVEVKVPLAINYKRIPQHNEVRLNSVTKKRATPTRISMSNFGQESKAARK